MEAKEILAKVKQLFSELTAPAPAPQPAKLMDYNLKDGSTVQIDNLAVGGIVTIDGNPALPGDIELEDGTKITVGDNGVIAALTPVSADPANPAPADPSMMEQEFKNFQTSANAKFADYETKLSAYEKRMAATETKLSKANKVIEQLLQLSQLIVDKPAAPADPAASRTNNVFNNQELKYDPALFS